MKRKNLIYKNTILNYIKQIIKTQKNIIFLKFNSIISKLFIKL